MPRVRHFPGRRADVSSATGPLPNDTATGHARVIMPMIDPFRRPAAHRGVAACSHGSVRTWSVVVPAKRLAVAKTRLRPLTAVLGDGTAAEHDALVLALLADTVTAAIACPLVTEVVVVTVDTAAADLVRALGAGTLADEPDAGLNPALEHGARSVAGPVAALSSDLPALRPEELAAALEAASAVPRAFVADFQGTGTTLLTAAGVPLRPSFGPASADAHRAGGAVPLSGIWPGLVRDVDTDADLRAAVALGTGPHTTALLGRLLPAGE
jgi:2-phospho-L-lactate guanylyltransferase